MSTVAELLDMIARLEAHNAWLVKQNALLRSGIDPDGEYLDGVARGMNIRLVGERVGQVMDEVPVC